MSRRRILVTAGVFVLLAALVYLQVQHWRSFDWAKFRAASHVHPLQIAIAIALIYITYLLRAWRWRVFLKPICAAKTSRLIGPTFIGFSGLALLGRPGELIRPYLIARKEQVPLSSQIGVWTVERIFDIGAFTVLMTIDVFFSATIRANPYVGRFRIVAVALCGCVALMAIAALMILRRGHKVAAFLHRVTSRISASLAHHVDHKVRAFGAGLNTIAGVSSFIQLVVLSLAIWLLIALAYREVAHSYPPEVTDQADFLVVDSNTAKLANLPELEGQELSPDTVEELRPALKLKGYDIQNFQDSMWLVRRGKRIKKIGDHPHLSDMDLSHVLLLMGFSMVGSVAQLPAVGGGSQLAVIGALEVVYRIPPELAVSCGILLWLVTFMACIPVGLTLAHREHLSLRQITREGEREEEVDAEEITRTPRPQPETTPE
jgi:glycosyltransferase 2 family protein